MDKHLLFTPSPVNVAETLRAAICNKDICHREADFDDLPAGIEHRLISLFQITKRERDRAVVITGSGTAASVPTAVAATFAILVGGTAWFIEAAVLIQFSHVLDCTDGRMARCRKVSSPVGGTFDRMSDRIQVTLGYGAAGYAGFAQSNSVTPVLLPLIGIAFYGLRGDARYGALENETARNPAEMAQMKQVRATAGPGFGLWANLMWFGRAQCKPLAFYNAVFVFMLSAALAFDQLNPMLWVFAASQVFWGLYRSWFRGKTIGKGRKPFFRKSLHRTRPHREALTWDTRNSARRSRSFWPLALAPV